LGTKDIGDDLTDDEEAADALIRTILYYTTILNLTIRYHS